MVKRTHSQVGGGRQQPRPIPQPCVRQHLGQQYHSPALVIPYQLQSHPNCPRLEDHLHQQQFASSQAISYPFTFNRDTDFPSSTETNESWPQSNNSASSFGSDFTQFGHQRRFSPGPLTPSSSEASFNSYEHSPVTEHPYVHITYPQAQSPQGVFVEAANASGQPLQGLETHGLDRTIFRGPTGALSSPLCRLPAQLAPSPPYQEPWNSYQFRHENPGEHAAFATREAHHGPGSPNSEGSTAAQRGGRSQPLSSDQRKKANKMRQHGVCIRCRIFKESCDENDPCAGCSRSLRKWKLGCVREWPKDRWQRLQPEKLVAHLRRDNFDTYINLNAYDTEDPFLSTFDLKLTLNLGRTFHLRIRDCIGFGPRIEERDVFRPLPWTQDEIHYERRSLSSPPIRPDFTFDSPEATQLREDIVEWVEEVLGGEELRTQTFPEYLFWRKSHEEWQRAVFAAICESYAYSPDSKILKDGLTLALLNYFMTKSLDVPEEDVPGLFGYLQRPLPPSACSPKVVNRFLKVLMYPDVEKLVKEVLGNFQTLLLDKNREGRDLFFSVSFILLMILARNQIAVLSQAVVTRDRQDEGLDMEAAKKLVRSMEEDFADPIIGLCQYWYEPNQKRRSPEAVYETELLARIRPIMAAAAPTFPLSLGLEDIDEKTFGSTNTERLLAKFYTSIWPL